MQKVSVMVPPVRSAPPGAYWAGEVIGWVFGNPGPAGTGLSAWLSAARARVVGALAANRDARARAELQALARRYSSTQPEFAKDLLAAASNDRSR